MRDKADTLDLVESADQRESSYRLLVDGVTDHAVYMLDVSGHVIIWNSGAQRIKQYTAAEIIGQHERVFYTDEEVRRGEPEANLEAAVLNGRFETNAWRRRKDGSQFWANVVIKPLRNDDGLLIGFAKVTSDISERRRSEQIIQESGERINAIIETMVDGVILIDSLGKIQKFNFACTKLFGYRREEVIGQNVKMLMPQHYRTEHDTYLENYHRTGVRKIVGSGREVVGERKDKSTFPMNLSVGETKQDGELLFVGVIHDLSVRKRTEEQLVQAKKMEMVGQLSGGIAHDFNNLLTVIIGNADTLSDKLRSRPDLRQLCDSIVNAGDRGAELTRRLLAFSRRQTLRPAVIDCNRLIESMKVLLRRALREDIEIATRLDTDAISAFADPAQLESAILNLALNARDAMPGGGLLRIATSSISLDQHYRDNHPEVAVGDYVLITVTDDGEGMSPEVCERAFEPFFTTKEVGKGSGLGLSMVYGFIKQSNGHVAIYSEIGLGTTVRLYLPAAQVARSADERADAEREVPTGSGNILVVEDDPFVRGYAVGTLESLGYQVTTAVNGQEALDKLARDTKFDVLFSDVVMPGGISGRDLAERAHKMQPDMKVLLTSGYALDVLAARGPLNEKLMILNKPYRKAELAVRLREILAGGFKPDQE